MSKHKYVDVAATLQVIGGIYIQPSLLDNEEYNFIEADFSTSDFHSILFGSIYNLHLLGAKQISVETIEDYLEQRPTQFNIYKSNKGSDFLEKLKDSVQLDAFPYYYNRIKKMTLLRMYHEKCGMDLSWFYDIDNIFDVQKKQAQEDTLDNTSVEQIATLIEKKIEDIKIKYADNCNIDLVQVGTGLDILIEQLKQAPDIGYPLYGKYINTIFRGARLSKFYARSAATIVGKTRAMVGDACYIGCGFMYNLTTNKWDNIGEPQPTLFIATEQSLSEVQQMMVAFISGVDEDHISTGQYLDGEEQRVLKAIYILKNSKLYFESVPDFSLQDIENIIKKGIKEYDVHYVFFDYLQTSLTILEEITRRSGGIKIREDNVLFMMSTRLKDMCNKYDIFILTSTQLNSNYQDAEVYDQNLLRGAKAIADKLDCGSILLEINQKDEEALRELCQRGGFEMPNVKMAVYKNRATKWKNILVWINANKGICRFEPMFITDYNYELIDMEDFKINIKNSEEISAY